MRELLFIFFATLIAGCISVAPVNNTDFGRISKIEQLEGVYKNTGEGPQSRLLSWIIWPDEKDLQHALVDTVEVRKVGEKTLLVRAVGEGLVKKESTFIEGNDFELKKGRIELKRHIGLSGFQKGDVMVGLAYESWEVGLDSEDQGKFRRRIRLVGLVFSILPMAMVGDEDVRFVKIKD